ncbi:MAG: hypothetical protein NZ525_00840, partial [Rhodothermia bacterium]|nr:hypothetical protein [Rhodothermia bacterium]
SWDLWDLFLEPEHASAYLVGFRKRWRSLSRQTHLAAELVHLETPRTILVRVPGNMFYVHGVVRHGYTHRGRLLGSDVATNGNLQAIALWQVRAHGSWGISAERWTPDVDRFYRLYRSGAAAKAPEVVWRLFLWAERRVHRYFASGALMGATRWWNLDYQEGLDSTGWLLSVWLRYRP